MCNRKKTARSVILVFLECFWPPEGKKTAVIIKKRYLLTGNSFDSIFHQKNIKKVVYLQEKRG